MPIVERSTRMMIRLSRKGCTNRPFFHVVVMRNRQAQSACVKDQIGTYDPLPNSNNERVVAINFDKLRWWMCRGAKCSQSVEIMLGLSGYLPIHPRTRLDAFRIQRKAEEAASKENKLISNADDS